MKIFLLGVILTICVQLGLLLHYQEQAIDFLRVFIVDGLDVIDWPSLFLAIYQQITWSNFFWFLVIAFVLFVIFTESHLMLDGEKLSQKQLQKLITQRIISSSDHVVLYYGTKSINTKEKMVIMTSEHLIYYNEGISNKIRLSEINRVEQTNDGGALSNDTFSVNTESGKKLIFEITTTPNYFHNKLCDLTPNRLDNLDT